MEQTSIVTVIIMALTNIIPPITAIGAILYSIYQGNRNAKTNANNIALNLFQTYMSVDYHENVRKPAWYALHKARHDADYRKRLLDGIAGATLTLGANDIACYERRRKKQSISDDDEYWLTHNDYHRVLDILNFFTALSLLRADKKIVASCNFFYDSWRSPLRKIVDDLEEKLNADGEPRDSKFSLKRRRLDTFKEMIEKLEDLYALPYFNKRKDECFQVSKSV